MSFRRVPCVPLSILWFEVPANQTLAGDPLAAAAEIGRPSEYLYNPDPAIVRAGHVDLLCEQLQLCRLDAEEEYLTGSLQVVSPFVRGFQVLAELPNNEREIRRFFRQTPFGEVEIKCRHIPIRADSLRRKLSLKGKRSAVLIFSRVSGRSRAFVCRRID